MLQMTLKNNNLDLKKSVGLGVCKCIYSYKGYGLKRHFLLSANNVGKSK